MKWTIRKKFLLGYLILFALSAFLVQQIMKDSLEESSRAAIESELTKLQYTTREYSKQFAQIHPPNNDLFTEYGNRMAQELSKLQKQSVAAYDSQGDFIYEAVPINQPLLVENQVYQTNSEQTDYPELKDAFDNRASFTRKNVENGTLIYFAYPVYIDDEFRGVFRFTGDYTEMFERNARVLRSFTILIVSLFLGVFLISLIFTTQIIKPLLRLTKATKRVAAGNYNEEVQVNSKDELELLAASFNEMQHSVSQHIEKVEREKDKVLLLEKTRTSFFNNVTHELKTPLTTISGYAQIIGEPDFRDPEFLRKATHKIRSESERMNRLVIDLIELSKSETTNTPEELEPIHLVPLMSSIAEDMYTKAQRRQLMIVVKGMECTVLGNQDEWRQIFINLLDNAIKYGVPNTVIYVVFTESTITVNNASEAVPEKIVSHIFEPFVYTKGTGSSGLGLMIVKQLVEKHGGTISFDYQEGSVEVKILIVPWQQVGNN